MIRHVISLVVLLLAPLTVRAAEPETVRFQTLHRDQVMLRGYLAKPVGDGPFPAVVMLHGCGGPLSAKGAIAARERAWIDRFIAEGFVVLLVDSFNPRGYGNICSTRNRPITSERDRPYDAYAALRWLRGQPYVRPDRVAVIGWSHGATTALAAISQAMIDEIGWREPGFTTAIVFYPGCLNLSKAAYATGVPLLMQLGAKDDWTAPRYCQRLAETLTKQGAAIEVDTYAGAYHGFDGPTSPVRTRSTSNSAGTRTVHVGRDPAAAEQSLARVKAWLAARLKEDGTN